MSEMQFGSARNPVQLIGINAPFQPKIQFGRAYQAGSETRAQAVSGFTNSGATHTTRIADNTHGINQPAPTRQQTILRSQLSPELQRQLNIGFSKPENQSRNNTHTMPNIDVIAAPNHQYRQDIRASYVTAVPTISGQMALRAISCGFG